MELVYNIFGTIFYILLFSWIFTKIRNIILIKKLNCKELYKNMRKDIKKQKILKYSFKFIIINAIILGIYIGIGIELAIIEFIFTMFVFIVYAISEDFYTIFSTFVLNYISLFEYIIYYIYIVVFIILIRGIYINILIYKKLKSNNIS